MSDVVKGNPDSSPQKFTSFFMKDILDSKEKTTEEDGSSNVQMNTSKSSMTKNPSVRIKKGRSHGHNEAFNMDNNDDETTRKSRSPFREKQRLILEQTFEDSKYISLGGRKDLAQELQLTERQVKTWFQNRRTKWRKVRGNEGLKRGTTQEEREKKCTAHILSNITEYSGRLSREWINQLHKQLSTS